MISDISTPVPLPYISSNNNNFLNPRNEGSERLLSNNSNNLLHNNNSRSRRFRCGISEVRALYVIGPIIMVILFTVEQQVLGFITLSFLSLFGLAILFRLLILARIRRAEISLANTLSITNENYEILPQSNNSLELMRDLMNLNPTAIRLAMLDRDFTPNDYDMLLRLDEESRALEFKGISQSSIDRLPTYIIKPPPTPVHISSPIIENNHDNGNKLSDSTSTSTSNESCQETADNACLICLEPKSVGEEIRIMSCLHQFHRHCIDKWLLENKSCPVCRLSAI